MKACLAAGKKPDAAGETAGVAADAGVRAVLVEDEVDEELDELATSGPQHDCDDDQGAVPSSL
jgi:hypothetical protein